MGTPAAGPSPDFVITADGELVSSRDLEGGQDDAEGTGDLVADLVLSEPPRRERPEDRVGRAPQGGTPSSAPTGAGPGGRTGPPPQAPAGASPPPPSPAPRTPNGNVPFAQPTVRGADGTPVIPGRPVSGVHGRPAAPPSPPPDAGRDRSLEIDDRSLAEQTFDALPVEGGGFHEEQTEGAQAHLGPPRGRPSAPTPGRLSRPVRERNRAATQDMPSAGPSAGTRSPSQQAEVLYREAIKAASVGDVAAARRHLRLALSYDPQNPQYRRAWTRLGSG